MPSNVKLLAGASGGEPTDANFKNVTLLLHGDGSNGAQNNTFIDSSTNNFTITRNGNTTQGSFSPYGSNWSNYFDGSGDYLSAPYSVTNSEWWTQDFTIEMWVYNNTNAVSSTTSLALQLSHGIATAVDTYWSFGTNASGQLDFYYFNGSANRVTSSASASLNTWNHIAMVYTHSSGNISLYLNGSRVATATKSGTPQNSSGSAINVGVSQNTFYNGYISNLRIIDGTALYSGTTYTVPTAPLTAITNTSLLTCAYNRFRDGSTNNFTITRNGDVKVTNFAPFAPSSAYSTTTNGGSAYFDGSGDYLSGPTSSSFDFGTGDFTVEAWFYMSALPALNASSERVASISAYTGGTVTANQGWEFYVNATTNRLVFSSWGSSNKADCSFTVSLGTWYHVAATRSGGTTRLFVNGVSQTLTTNTLQTNNDTNANIRVGTSRGDSGYEHDFPGYLSNLRIVKGTAVYTADFTIPSSPVTAVTNTQLLTNFTNAAIFDNSMKNNLETVGNAQISTSVKKFGTGSMYFDGNGDYLTPASRDAGVFGTGDFTVECWVYATGAPQSNQVIWNCNQYPNTTGLYLAYYGSGSTQISVAGGGSSYINASGGWSLNEWHHVAVVRSGSTMTLYIDGTSRGSATFTNNCSDGLVFIGRPYDVANYMMQGYIDELRITKGVARYTANFTAPTAPFPNK